MKLRRYQSKMISVVLLHPSLHYFLWIFLLLSFQNYWIQMSQEKRFVVVLIKRSIFLEKIGNFFQKLIYPFMPVINLVSNERQFSDSFLNYMGVLNNWVVNNMIKMFLITERGPCLIVLMHLMIYYIPSTSFRGGK